MKLTNDTKELVATSLRKGRFVSKTLQDKIENDTVTPEDIKGLSFLLEGHVGDALKGLDYDSVLEAQQDQRYEEIRQANHRIQELEKQLANTHELSGFSGMFNKIQDILRDWWKQDGFNHVDNTKLLSHGVLEVTFAFVLSGRVSMFSKHPEADRADLAQHIQALRAQGFAFNDDSEYSVFDKDLLDTPKNQALLAELVQKRFASFEVKSFEVVKHDGTPVITSFTGIIKDLCDLDESVSY